MEAGIARQAAPAEASSLSMRQGLLSMADRDAVQPMAGTGPEALVIPQNPILRPPEPAPSVRDSLVARSPLLRRLLGKAMAVGYRLLGKDRYDNFRVERVCGMPFVVTPSVFNPKIPRTGEFFAAQIDSK